MSTAGIAAPEMRLPLKTGFLHSGQGLGGLKTCWSSHGGGFENSFFNMDPVTMAYSLDPSAQHRLMSVGHASYPDASQGHGRAESGCHASPSPPLLSPPTERPTSDPGDGILPGFGRLSLDPSGAPDATPPLTPVKSGPLPLLLFPPGPSSERSARPLPPLPLAQDLLLDEVDREVEFLTGSDTDFLLEGGGGGSSSSSSSPAFTAASHGRLSFRGCGQINYAYAADAPTGLAPEEPPPTSVKQSGCAASAGPPPPPPPPAQQLHRRLRRSHSGPAGSFHKPVARASSHVHGASPSSGEEKPEVPPRAPIPPRVLKPDYRRWSAEVASCGEEEKPPRVPPREPLSQSLSRTPSPKSLPSYLHGVMPATQSFAPDPKYVSSKALQRQHSEGCSSSKAPCILPIIEKGKKVSSTHYYLLPERPPYLDRYEKFFQEAEEASGDSAEGGRQQQP
ncbi:ERBB receptor feedback inhibitor 1 [Elgaria multicarinata webbii]|uniref:ERBB receptor feedback inhibitor 1 n=1 Tax=Elgaria multicarinata webbii TaxID=159646 RepID=UPI002FCD229F